MLKGQKRLPAISVSHPELAKQWHNSRNSSFSPERLTANSNYRAWWQCTKHDEHIWQRSISRRVKSGSSCPHCHLEANCLGSLFPDIARQWHPTLNGELTPSNITAGSERKVWWQCPLSSEHVYETTVYARTGTGSNCHFCSWIKVDSQRSLALRSPEIARELHPTRNGDLKAEQVSYGSSKYVWWRCRQDSRHEWQEVICTRTSKNDSCPFCSGYYLTDKNRLSTCFPAISEEWHSTKNRKLWTEVQGTWHAVRNRRVPPLEREKNRRLTPADVSINSHELVWWKCKTNPEHLWQAVVADRVRNRTGCPFCTNQKVGNDNNLLVLFPIVARALWHPSRNLPLLPSQVVPGSSKVVWWRCPKSADHVWQAPVYRIIRARKEGHAGCPFCSSRRKLAQTGSIMRFTSSQGRTKKA